MMIKLVEIHKIYKDENQGFLALKDINLDFTDDHFVCILGKSGSGKTTLLNIIGGLDEPSSGHMVINGELTTKFTPIQWDYFRNYKIGFIFQNYSLIEHLTVLDNVKLAVKLQGISDIEAKKRALDMLDRVGIIDQKDKLPLKLSGGQRQRVAIARALVNDPEVIFADEPTGNLDKKTAKEIMDLLKEFSKEKLIIMVTHNKRLANIYADRIIELKDGSVISDTKAYLNEKVLIKTPERLKTTFRLIDKIKLSLKNIRMKKWRSLLIAFGLAIGIASFILLDGISHGIKTNLENNRLNITSEPDLRFYITKETFDDLDKTIDEYMAELLNHKGISDVRYNREMYYSKVIEVKGEQLLNIYSNISYPFTDKENLIGKPYADGHWPNNDNEIMISYSLAQDIYNNKNLEILWNKLKGATIKIATEYYYQIPYEIYEPYTTSCAIYPFVDENTPPTGYDSERFGDYSEQLQKQKDYYGKYITDDVNNIYLCSNYDAFNNYRSELVKTSREFTIVGINENKQLNEDYVTKNVYMNWNNEVLKRYVFDIYLSNYGKNNSLEIKRTFSDIARVEDVFVFDILDSIHIEVLLGIAQFIISLILIISVVTAGLMLIMLLSISVIERSREIGILRSLGATKNDIFSIFISESAVIGFMAGIIGVILSIVVSLIGNLFIRHQYGDILTTSFNNPNINLIITRPLAYVIAVFICIVLAMLFGFIPAIRASRKTPINALKKL